MQFRRVFCNLAFAFVAASAAMPALAAEPPAQTPAKTDKVPLLYRVLLRLSLNLDDVFTKVLGLEPVTCRFLSSVDGRAYSHPGIGPCLYRSWRAGQQTNEIPGLIEAVVRPARGNGETVGMQLKWRSAEGKLVTSVSRILKMRKDKGLPEDMREHTLLGTIIVEFERGIEPSVLLGSAVGSLLMYQDKNVKRLELDTNHDPDTGRETHAMIRFFVEGSDEAAFELEVHTDYNILKKRGFFLKLEGK